MANKHMTRLSVLIVIREKQIQSTMNYHYMPTRMDKIKITDCIRYW